MRSTNLRITLKAARVNAGLTQEEAAQSLNISAATYNAWEKDPGKITATKQSQLSQLFGIPIDCIIFLPDA